MGAGTGAELAAGADEAGARGLTGVGTGAGAGAADDCGWGWG